MTILSHVGAHLDLYANLELHKPEIDCNVPIVSLLFVTDLWFLFLKLFFAQPSQRSDNQSTAGDRDIG